MLNNLFFILLTLFLCKYRNFNLYSLWIILAVAVQILIIANCLFILLQCPNVLLHVSFNPTSNE